MGVQTPLAYTDSVPGSSVLRVPTWVRQRHGGAQLPSHSGAPQPGREGQAVEAEGVRGRHRGDWSIPGSHGRP